MLKKCKIFNSVLLNIIFIKESWKNVFNIKNNNNQKINEHQKKTNQVLGSCETEDWSNDAENSASLS